MKKKLLYCGIAALTLGFVSCNQNAKNAENAENADSAMVAEQPAEAPAPAFDKVGAYAGTLPCADCSGLETTVELMGDMTYKTPRVRRTVATARLQVASLGILQAALSRWRMPMH